MRNLFLAVAAAVSAAYAPIATAADLPVKAPPLLAAPADLWTGLYLGANIGGGWAQRTIDGYTANDPIADGLFASGGSPPPASFNSSGVLGGIQIGYNWRFDSRWLVGIETDFSGSGMKGSVSTNGVYAPYFIAPFTAPFEERIDWFGTLRARLGYLVTDDLLLYGTSGFAYGRVARSGSWTTSNGFAVGGGGFGIVCTSDVTCFTGSSSHVGIGWTAGGGIEYALSAQWRVRAEYIYVSLAANALTETALEPTPGVTPSSFNANFGRAKFNVVRAGVNYRF
jgi:outer membrane immunogenic protein